MILIVDDNPAIAQLFEETLADAGYQTEVARTGAEAVEMMAERHYRLALMDLSLPDMNGAEVTSLARAQGNGLPVIAVTGALKLIDPAKLADARFSALIEKPLRLSALLELIEKHALPV